jgi:beta-mannosidase
MTDRIQRVSPHHRTGLEARWTLCATAAGTILAPDELHRAGQLAWIPIASRDTVAGALRRARRWSLDAPTQRFDAEDWWFRAAFYAPARSGESRRSLEFGGLAGECCIWLNGVKLVASDNMHLTHECVEPLVIDGENELLMRFASLDTRLAQRHPRPRWRAPMMKHAQLRWARVSLLGRTPGWSPPAPAIGPWREIEWVDRTDIDVSALRLRSEVDGKIGRLALNVGLTPIGKAAKIDTVTLQVTRNGARHHVAAVPTDGSRTSYAAQLAIPDAALWWPHTHGEPALYRAAVVIRLVGAEEPVSVDLGCIGFRTLTVDTTEGDFLLRVNGVPVFCRGANWTPLDIVSPAAPAEATRAAIAQVQAAGLNMLRVNGCMVYEDDCFFEACDALGVLVWQDFMFANMDYPVGDTAFTASVHHEARQHLTRWQAHPSLAVICGNSEAEQQAAMRGSSREVWSQPLFDEQLAALARELCPDVMYWPSSAHGGTFPHQSNCGTTSYYGVGAYLRPMDDARRSGLRFATESLAFANVPPPAALARMPGGAGLRANAPEWKARTPRDLGAGWDFEDVRDHYAQHLFGIDPLALRSSDHDQYLTLSRAVSAEVIQATFSEWRRPGSDCRGALVWFLRDMWAGAGWGLLDERGAPKAAFHGLRRASSPIHLFLTDEGTNGPALHVVNDPGAALVASVEIALFRDDGLRMQASTRPIAVPAHDGRTWAVVEWFDTFIDLSRAYRFGPPEHALVAATLRDAAGKTLDRAFFFPEGLPAVRRRDVELKILGMVKEADGAILVSVRARTFAQSVYFDAEGYFADDEFFHLAPGETLEVRLRPSPGCAERAKRVSVLALNSWSGAAAEICP